MAAWNVPIIGDSLSDATRQYSDWQRVNLGTEAANIARRNEAERYWNSQVAQRDQEAYQRQQTEEQRRLNQEAVGREQYRWETGRKDVAARDELTAKLEREKIAAQYGGQRDEQENVAENLAQPIAETGARLDAATADWEAKTTALNTAVDNLSRQAPGLIKYDSAKGVKMFKPVKQADEAADKVAQAAAAKANAQAAELINAHVLSENALENIRNEFGTHAQKLGNNLTYAKRDGKYVVVNLLGKPGMNEHRWVPQAITGPPLPVPAMADQSAWPAATPPAPPAPPVAPAPGPTVGHAAFGGTGWVYPSGVTPPTATRTAPSTQPYSTGGWPFRSYEPPSAAYASEFEARAAGHADGDIVIINGRRAQLTPD